jgi:hypothetical protein
VIGLGAHAMSAGPWVFVAVRQLVLILLAAFAIWLAAPATRQGSRR